MVGLAVTLGRVGMGGLCEGWSVDVEDVREILERGVETSERVERGILAIVDGPTAPRCLSSIV